MSAVTDALEEWRAAERRLQELTDAGADELELWTARMEFVAAKSRYRRAFEEAVERVEATFQSDADGR